MKATANLLPLDSYNSARKEQSSRVLATRLADFANRTWDAGGLVQGAVADVAHRRLDQSPAISPPAKRPLKLFSRNAPYTIGEPDPPAIVQPLEGEPKVVSSQSFGDRNRGELSVAVNGGLISGAGFGGGASPYEIPMPERWLLGDAISSSAAVVQVEGIPTGLEDLSHLRVVADFGLAPAPLRNTVISDPLDECLTYHPGLDTSALDGFIGITVYFEVAVTLCAGSTIIATSSNSANILTYGINSELTGITPDNNTFKYLLREWAFEGDPTGAIPVSLIIPFDHSADQVIVEARACFTDCAVE